jgi:uncharacterized membrane protein
MRTVAFAAAQRVTSVTDGYSRHDAEFLMTILVLGLVIFLGLHSIRIFAEGGRERAIARIGEGPWKGLYSLLSAIGFVLIVWGFGEARYASPALYAPPLGARHVTIALMLVSMLLLAAYLFKQSHITAAVHHPMVWSVAVFGLAHLIANGSAADVVLFGAFLVWAAADLVSSYARDSRERLVYPEPKWSATLGGIAVGLVFWAVIALWLHKWLFGVSPLAG